MSTYNEIKKSIDQVRKDIVGIKRNLSRNEEDQREIRRAVDKAESTFQLNLRQEKDTAQQEFVQQSVAEISNEIQSVQQQIAQTQQEYDSEIEHIKNLDIASQYSDEQAITAEVRASLAVLQEQLTKTISPRFQNELEGQFETQEIAMSSEEIEEVIKYFNKQSRMIEHMGSSSWIDKLIDKILQVVRIPSLEKSEQAAKVSFGILSVLFVVLVIVAGKFLFPFYVLFLGVLLFYNVNKHYKIFSALIAQKTVKDNLKLIDESLRNKALEQQQALLQETQERYDAQLLHAQEELDSLKHKKDSATMSAMQSFTFDDADLQSRYNNAIKINNKRLEQLTSEKDSLQHDLSSAQNELQDLECQLHAIAGNVQSEYLDLQKIGTSPIFNPQFIIDIKKSKPTYFTHLQAGMLFLYNDSKDVSNFIRLLLLQLRIKLSPHNMNCTIIDTQDLGIDYLPFKPNNPDNDEAINSLFRIIGDKEKIKETIDDLVSSINTRVAAIRQDYDNIAAYNQAMVESDSLTESYEFVFYQNPEARVLSDLNMQQLYRLGGPLGIFVHLFIKKDVFYEMGDLAEELVESSEGIYLLQDGSLLKRAKEFVSENLIKHKD
jgi:hypothetical protein